MADPSSSEDDIIITAAVETYASTKNTERGGRHKKGSFFNIGRVIGSWYHDYLAVDPLYNSGVV